MRSTEISINVLSIDTKSKVRWSNEKGYENAIDSILTIFLVIDNHNSVLKTLQGMIGDEIPTATAS